MSAMTWADQKIELARSFKEQHDAGEMTTEEYLELLEDLQNADEIEGQADAMEAKAKLEAFVTGLITLL